MDSAFGKLFELTFQVWALLRAQLSTRQNQCDGLKGLVLYDDSLGLWRYISSLLGNDWFSWLTGNSVYCGPGQQGRGQLMQQLWTLSAAWGVSGAQMKKSTSFFWVTVRMSLLRTRICLTWARLTSLFMSRKTQNFVRLNPSSLFPLLTQLKLTSCINTKCSFSSLTCICSIRGLLWEFIGALWF